jgi:HPt (histidine-containing phosphotransfer) domain-containing protein
MKPPANPGDSPDLAAMLDGLWARFLPELRERVAILESAAQSLAAGTLTTEQQQNAQAAAHKFAGVLGTFNLDRGTEVARELELGYESIPDSSAAPRLAQLSTDLRTLIESRK